MTQKSEGIICPRQPLNDGSAMIGWKSSPSSFSGVHTSESYNACLLGRSCLDQTSVAHSGSMKKFTTVLAFSTSCMSFSPLPLLLPGMIFPIKLLDMMPCLILYFPGWGCTQLQNKIIIDLSLFLETMDWSEYKSEIAAIAKLVTKSPHPCV